MFSAGGDFDKIGKVTNTIDTVGVTLRSNVHINDLVKNANAIITGEFVMHMSREAVSNPKKFQHMYEWGQVGDPHGRLWKHILRGRGSMRQLTWDFRASKKTVPVSDTLRSIGVKQIHRFEWKAPVLELGLPVRISPKLAKMLVFEAKENARRSSVSGEGYEVGGIVFHKGTIAIARQGNSESWGAFTNEFNTWFRSGAPEIAIRASVSQVAQKTVKRSVLQRVAQIATSRTKTKTFTLQAPVLDRGFQAKLENSLRADYIGAAAQRRALVAEDEV